MPVDSCLGISHFAAALFCSRGQELFLFSHREQLVEVLCVVAGLQSGRDPASVLACFWVRGWEKKGASTAELLCRSLQPPG